MARGDVVEIGIFGILRHGELHFEVAVFHKHGIFLSGLLQIVNGVEEWKHVVECLRVFVAGIILEVEGNAVTV